MAHDEGTGTLPGAGAPHRVLRARTGVAVPLAAGAAVEIVNPGGSQVVDTWALVLPDGTEHLSVAHTRAVLGRLVPRLGDTLHSDRREAVLTLVEDTSPGTHDMLVPACDPARYRLLGAEGHANCRDNFVAAVTGAGLPAKHVPDPLNLFMNVPVAADGTFAFAAPRSAPGDRVRLRAEKDVLVVLSACPQDLLPVNGARQEPADVHYRVVAPPGTPRPTHPRA
jgi:uncharacterized protein YcgI (DUF1989 family)